MVNLRAQAFIYKVTRKWCTDEIIQNSPHNNVLALHRHLCAKPESF